MTGTITHARAGLLTYKLDQPMGGSGVSEVDVIVAEVSDNEGTTGFGFSYVIAGGGAFAAERASDLAARLLRGQPLKPPQVHWRAIYKTFNRTALGVNLIALAALDVALWDLVSKRQGVPLGVALGGEPRPVPVYASGGFAPGMAPDAAAEIASRQISEGMAGVKPRIGGRPDDAQLLSAVSDVVSGRGWLMADMNEKGDLTRARWTLDMAREHGVFFIEEPLPAGDREGLRVLAAHASTTIATGEHLQAVTAFAELAKDGLASVLQPDLAMVGGITPSLHIAQMAEPLGAQVMPHFLPGLYCQLAAASPAVTMLEDFPLLEPLFETMPPIKDGHVTPSGQAGHGLKLDAGRAAKIAWI